MIELNVYQNNSSTSAQYGMWYVRAAYKCTPALDLWSLATAGTQEPTLLCAQPLAD